MRVGDRICLDLGSCIILIKHTQRIWGSQISNSSHEKWDWQRDELPSSSPTQDEQWEQESLFRKDWEKILGGRFPL